MKRISPLILTHKLNIPQEDIFEIPIHFFCSILENDIFLKYPTSIITIDENKLKVICNAATDFRITPLKRNRNLFESIFNHQLESLKLGLPLQRKDVHLIGLFDNFKAYSTVMLTSNKNFDMFYLECHCFEYEIELKAVSRRIIQHLLPFEKITTII